MLLRLRAPCVDVVQVLDLSLMPPTSIEKDDYLADFTREAVGTLRAHRRRFAERCRDADGIGCASVEAVEAIRGGRGVEVPPLSPAAARGLARKANVTAGGAGWGWVWAGSRYRGEAGEGEGQGHTWRTPTPCTFPSAHR